MKCVIEDKSNFGRSRCNNLPNLPSGMITTDDDVVIPKATLEDPALLLTFLNEKILAKKAWYWPNFASFENISQEPAYEDTPLAYLAINDGNYRFRFGISENICFHKAAYTHRAIGGRVIVIDKLNQLLLTETSTGDGKGLGIQLLNSEKFVFNDGGVATKSPIVVALRNNKEIDKSGILVVLDAYDELYRIVDTELLPIVDGISSTEIVLDVLAECDGTPVLGLLTADFIKKDDAGDTEALTAVSNGNGRYTLTAATTFTDGTLELRTPDLLTVKAYEAAAIDIEIPT